MKPKILNKNLNSIFRKKNIKKNIPKKINTTKTYVAKYNVAEIKYYDRNNKQYTKPGVVIEYLYNKTQSKNKTPKINVKELNLKVKETIDFAKKNNVKYLTFSTWIFVEHPNLETLFKQKYNLELFACNFEQINKFAEKYENKKIKGIVSRKFKIIYETPDGKIKTKKYNELPEYIFKIKD